MSSEIIKKTEEFALIMKVSVFYSVLAGSSEGNHSLYHLSGKL